MYYQINVAIQSKPANQTWNGKPEFTHFFATAPQSCTDRESMLAVHRELSHAFPSPTYLIEVTHKVESGTVVDVAAMRAAIAARS